MREAPSVSLRRMAEGKPREPGTPGDEAATRDAPEAEPERIARGRAYALHPAIRLVWLAHRLAFWGIAGAVFFALLRFAEGFAASRFPPWCWRHRCPWS